MRLSISTSTDHRGRIFDACIKIDRPKTTRVTVGEDSVIVAVNDRVVLRVDDIKRLESAYYTTPEEAVSEQVQSDPEPDEIVEGVFFTANMAALKRIARYVVGSPSHFKSLVPADTAEGDLEFCRGLLADEQQQPTEQNDGESSEDS